MNEVFFIADTHFNHKHIVEIREKTRSEIRQHRGPRRGAYPSMEATVGMKDTVWHLGDFGFGKRGLQVAGRLNGKRAW
jgi:calcineurin-like phosphoesterase family protein